MSVQSKTFTVGNAKRSNAARLPTLAGIAAALLPFALAGCITTQGNVPSKYYLKDLVGLDVMPRAIAVEQNRKPVVVLRYLAEVEPVAMATAKSRFEGQTFYGGADASPESLDRFKQLATRAKNAFEVSLIKTTYFASQFYEHLIKALPEADVILQPQQAVLDDLGRLEIRSFYETPPATLLVDFYAYVHPRATPGTADFVCSTYGHFICPIISIRTAPSAAPQTQGALAGIDLLMPYMNSYPERPGAQGGLGLGIGDFIAIAYQQDQPAPSGLLDKVMDERPLLPGKFLAYPYAHLRLGDVGRDRKKVLSPDHYYEDSTDAGWLFESYGLAVADALATINLNAARDAGLAEYARFVDPDLAEAYAAGRSVPAQDTRIRIIRQFAAKEVEFLRDKDEQYIEKMNASKFPGSVEEFMAQESSSFFAIKQDQGMQFAVGAMAGLSAAAAANQNNAGGAALLAGFSVMMVQGITSFMGRDAAQFDSHYQAAIDDQRTYIVEFLDGTEEVKARNLSELRERMRELYEAKVLSRVTS